MLDKQNPIAKILVIIGLSEIVVGFIVGIIFAIQEVPGVYGYTEGFIWSVAFTWWIASFVSGMLIIGFSEVIEILDSKLTRSVTLLEKIKYIMDSNTETNHEISTQQNNESKSSNESWFLVDEDKERIKAFFENHSPVEKIIKSHLEDYCFVKLQNGSYKLVKVGGFKPELIDEDRWGDSTQEFFREEILKQSKDDKNLD